MDTKSFPWLVAINVTALALVGLTFLYIMLFDWGWQTGQTVTRHVHNLLLVCCVVWGVSALAIGVQFARRLSGQN